MAEAPRGTTTAGNFWAKPTAAVIEELRQGPAIERNARATTYPVNAAVRYVVDGTEVNATVEVGRCPGPRCSAYRQGQTITVAYDPDNPAQAVLTPAGRSPSISPRLLFFGLTGIIFVAVAVINAIGRWWAWRSG